MRSTDTCYNNLQNGWIGTKVNASVTFRSLLLYIDHLKYTGKKARELYGVCYCFKGLVHINKNMRKL